MKGKDLDNLRMGDIIYHKRLKILYKYTSGGNFHFRLTRLDKNGDYLKNIIVSRNTLLLEFVITPTCRVLYGSRER